MPNQRNLTVVEKLREKLSKARSVILTDYRGLTHKQSEELHRAVAKAGGEFVVVKNSLLKIAGGPETTGPTAILVAYEDELAPLKELYKTIKNLSLPKIKFGAIGKVVYDEAEINRIAQLPTQQILQAQLVSRLNSPIYSLVYALNYNLQKLAYVLKAVSNK